MARCMVGVSVVKNEADIIEANVRHNLGFLDRIIVFDHDSCDATRRILDALVAEGLPITLLARRADRPEFGFWQGEFTTALAKLAFEQHGADFVFPIDADEFIDAPSRAAIEAALDACPNEVANVEWRTYVPDPDAAPGAHPLEAVRWRIETAAPALPKIVISRRVMSRDWLIARGNHAFCNRSGNELSIHEGEAVEGFRLAHVPFRSPQQLTAKVLVGWLSRKLAYGAKAESTRHSWHIRELFGRIAGGETIGMADLRRYAVALYALNRPPGPDDEREYALTEAPVAPPMPLRYTEAGGVDPARL
ncbi:MAG TPA: glycosyltransferase family 2 protein, partial [Rhodanobacteraceae bacterium]